MNDTEELERKIKEELKEEDKKEGKKYVFQAGKISFVNALTLIFITLKLCHVIDWGWGWVVSPIWISVSIGVTFMLIVLIIAFIDWLINR